MSANDNLNSPTETTDPTLPAETSARVASAAAVADPGGQAALGDIRGDIVAFVAIVVMAGAGGGLFFRTSVYLTLGLVSGLAAGLGCTRWWRAVVVCALGVLAGFALASLVAAPAWPGGMFWLPNALETAAVAALVGGAVNFAVGQSARLKPLISAVAVLALIATMWFSGFSLASVRTSVGLTPLEQLARVPRLDRNVSDGGIYLNYLEHLRAGEPYYKMAVNVIRELNAARPESPVAIDSPLSYRLPTLYVLLAQAPSPGALIDLMLLAASLGVVAAYVLARQYVAPVPALVGAALVASMFSGYASPILLDTESWAGILAICAVMFVVLARRHERRTFLLHSAAAGCAFLAASVRELSVAFLLLGLAAALLDRTGSRRRAWVPWAMAFVATGALYAAHWMAASAAFHGLACTRTAGFPWFHPDGSGLVSAVGLLATFGWLVPWLAGLLVALGIIGSVLAPKDLPSRVMLTGVALGGPLVLLLLHPPGWAHYGAAPGYWGDLVIPTTLACVPLVFAALASVRREDEPG